MNRTAHCVAPPGRGTRLGLDDEQGDRVRDHVVHLAGDPGAFGVDRPLGERLRPLSPVAGGVTEQPRRPEHDEVDDERLDRARPAVEQQDRWDSDGAQCRHGERPGPGGMRLKRTPLNLSYIDTFKTRWPEAYERLILDVVRGNATLFMRRDEVEEAWAWVEPIIDEWTRSDVPISHYQAGTWGPSAAVALMARDGRNWVDPET